MADYGEVIKIVKEAGDFLRNRDAASHISVKGASDYVTDTDRRVQEFIAGALRKLYPEIQFLGEEKDNSEIDMSGSVWVLDPVDGTTNLIHDYKRSCISLALMVNREVKFGIIYQPWSEELFYAEKGRGAFLNEKPIHVSSAQTMADSLIAVGTSPYDKEELGRKNFDYIYHIFMDSQDIRRSGSAAIDLADVAAGRTEAFFEQNLKIWDYAAGKLLVEEAGGKVGKFDGSEIAGEMRSEVLGANPFLYKILSEKYLGSGKKNE